MTSTAILYTNGTRFNGNFQRLFFLNVFPENNIITWFSPLHNAPLLFNPTHFSTKNLCKTPYQALTGNIILQVIVYDPFHGDRKDLSKGFYFLELLQKIKNN